ncbi:unnamed protein product [Lampetra fluviatilis]
MHTSSLTSSHELAGSSRTPSPCDRTTTRPAWSATRDAAAAAVEEEEGRDLSNSTVAIVVPPRLLLLLLRVHTLARDERHGRRAQRCKRRAIRLLLLLPPRRSSRGERDGDATGTGRAAAAASLTRWTTPLVSTARRPGQARWAGRAGASEGTSEGRARERASERGSEEASVSGRFINARAAPGSETPSRVLGASRRGPVRVCAAFKRFHVAAQGPPLKIDARADFENGGEFESAFGSVATLTEKPAQRGRRRHERGGGRRDGDRLCHFVGATPKERRGNGAVRAHAAWHGEEVPWPTLGAVRAAGAPLLRDAPFPPLSLTAGGVGPRASGTLESGFDIGPQRGAFALLLLLLLRITTTTTTSTLCAGRRRPWRSARGASRLATGEPPAPCGAEPASLSQPSAPVARSQGSASCQGPRLSISQGRETIAARIPSRSATLRPEPPTLK